ncbi:hypothetical protein CQJ94_15780 [Glycomyces fuscus]|nr:hypothetical protein CQJ94_15780 [Glycomyces fuscus]
MAVDRRHSPGEDLEDALYEALDPLMAPYDERVRVPPHRDHEYEDDWDGAHDDALDFYTRHPEHARGLDLGDRAAVLSSWVGEPVLWDDEVGSHYVVTTDNPRAKWDYWAIGGRYRGMLLSSDHADPRVLPGGEQDPRRVTGAPKHLLAFAEHRARAEDEAARQWDAAHAVLRRNPPAETAEALVERARTGEFGGDRAAAIRHHRSQPAVRELLGAGLEPGMSCPVEWYSVPRDEFTATARDQAVPGYAFLDLDGTWYDRDTLPGYEGPDHWLPRRREYLRRANPAIDALPDDTYLVTVDCHV